MSQTLSTEEILHRMRIHIDQIKMGSPTLASGQVPAGSDSSYAPAAPATTATAFAQSGPSDFVRLQSEIEAALEGTRQVGQLNPRQPGLLNDIIQFVKKVMRRSLSWYTRPIHYYQGAVIRALQQTLNLLLKHEESLNSLSQAAQDSSNYRAAMTEEIALLKYRASVLQSTTSALDDKVSGIAEASANLQIAKADLLVRISAVHDSTLRLADRASAIDQSLSVAASELASDFEQRLSNTAESHNKSLNQALAPYSQRLAGITDEIGWLRDELDRLRNQLRETILQKRLRDRDLRRYFHDIQAMTSPSFAALPIPPMFPSGIKGDSEFDYFRFEELFRGDEALIATRQKEYLEFFLGRENVVDIGCGRGEFLELMRDNGIKARGVELGTDQYLLCREKGLDVVQEDLFTFLESLPDESLGGLFSAQVIEHLTASDQLRFVSLAYKKTIPGSPVIFETINAQSVFAVVRNFFLDPTHVRPVHPDTLKFAMQSVKFHDVELRYSSPLLERRIPALQLNGDDPPVSEFNRAIEELNDLIYGYLDFAAIGWH